MPTSPQLGKLRWLCRRGMKELDVLLEHFYHHRADHLTESELDQFVNLLSQEDDVLWDWLQDPNQCTELPLRNLLEQIRNG